MATAKNPRAKAAKKDVDFILEVDGVEYPLSMDDLTFREAADLETFFGVAASDINYGSLTAVMYLTYIALHRADPSITLEDIGDRKVKDVTPKTSDPKDAASSEPQSEDGTSGDPS